MQFDAFNGDADGICALHQMRLAEPLQSTLVTGVKRDIGLLKKIDAQVGDHVLALDIAVEKNTAALAALLEKGVTVRWFDHHNPGELPEHPNFQANIDTAADVCTSLLVDRHLGGKYRVWAVTAAFGDNLHEAARHAAEPLRLDGGQLDQLRELGECLNYNGYGESLEDLHFHPAELYRALSTYADPFAFIEEAAEFATLSRGYAADMALAAATRASETRASGAVFILPDAAWARRVSGVYANDLATANPDRAHALLTRSPKGHYVVSVRAPLADKRGADLLCQRFDTGGGRKAAAGINILPEARIPDFIAAFFETYPA
ncbi:MAG: acetyltransferase [Pseudomonadota bacterium]|nr:acetyltransferase [Pseudomonadota bacterium]MDP1905115.1 acetyltransferase [Pseudomonadota bacterium]MDP2351971.1 acetyltransferase [Pseudomonadota bacterium]